MTVTHDTFRIERRYPASPARVWAACTDEKAKAVWFGISDGYELDFRVGGTERSSGSHEGHEFRYEAVFTDIVEGERIVATYVMQVDGRRMSVSVQTTQFQADGDGTLLVLTEQGAYLDGLDTSAMREHGTGELLNALGAALAADA